MTGGYENPWFLCSACRWPFHRGNRTGTFCPACRKAWDRPPALPPARTADRPVPASVDPGREGRLAVYESRAELGLDLFGGG